jgi:hypothetical protein
MTHNVTKLPQVKDNKSHVKHIYLATDPATSADPGTGARGSTGTGKSGTGTGKNNTELELLCKKRFRDSISDPPRRADSAFPPDYWNVRKARGKNLIHALSSLLPMAIEGKKLSVYAPGPVTT